MLIRYTRLLLQFRRLPEPGPARRLYGILLLICYDTTILGRALDRVGFFQEHLLHSRLVASRVSCLGFYKRNSMVSRRSSLVPSTKC